jgi:DNA-binding Lrp family transcriptional regulator
MRSLDPIDEEIVRALVQDGRISNAALARQVGLSPNATGVRVGRLFASGVLSGVHARVNHAVLGKQLEVIIDCTLVDATDDSALRALVAQEERVVESLFVTGSVDHRLRAVVESPQDLGELLGRLVNEGGVNTSDTRLIVERHEVAGLPGTALPDR